MTDNNTTKTINTNADHNNEPAEKTALDCMNNIFSSVDETGFNQKTVAALRQDIDYVKSLLNIDGQDADLKVAILSGLLEHPIGGRLTELATFLGLGYIEMLIHKSGLKSMEAAGLICSESDDDDDEDETDTKAKRDRYFITAAAQRAIENNQPFNSSTQPQTIYQAQPQSQSRTSGDKDIIRSSSIKAKQLFYNSRERELVEQLADLLEAEKFKQVQSRLEESGLRKGFSVIFYGGPGTGKTATVFELARRSGRDVYFVDMPGLMSKWIGETENRVKAVFSNYRKLCKMCDKAPILLFNEADAIFGRRVAVERVEDQSNNSVQNILLQEMENLDGIMIATTNLTQNLDPAFERRFIYKIQFKNPDEQTRKQILQSLIPGLSDTDATSLAAGFPSFSGGNIENVARKSTVNYVLTGLKPDLATLTDFCRGEQISHSGTGSKIGYAQRQRQVA